MGKHAIRTNDCFVTVLLFQNRANPLLEFAVT
jgi:hypothetical protein